MEAHGKRLMEVAGKKGPKAAEGEAVLAETTRQACASIGICWSALPISFELFPDWRPAYWPSVPLSFCCWEAQTAAASSR